MQHNMYGFDSPRITQPPGFPPFFGNRYLIRTGQVQGTLYTSPSSQNTYRNHKVYRIQIEPESTYWFSQPFKSSIMLIFSWSLLEIPISKEYPRKINKYWIVITRALTAILRLEKTNGDTIRTSTREITHLTEYRNRNSWTNALPLHFSMS